MLIAELQRLNSHLVWLATHGMEVGAVSVMLYCFREREQLLNINEMLAGFRMFPSYIRIGGLREDLPRGFHDAVSAFLDKFPAKLDEYEQAAHEEPDLDQAHQGVGQLSKRRHAGLGLVGPIARAVGHPLRRPQDVSYLGYETFDFDVPRRPNGDVYARIRFASRRCGRASASAARRSSASRRPASTTAATTASCRRRRIACTPRWKALIQHFLIYSQGFNVPAGERYVPVEGPRGEHGFYIVSDGTNRPWRVKRARRRSGVPGAAADDHRRPDRRRHRRDRIDRRRDGRRGSMSFPSAWITIGATTSRRARSADERDRRSPTRRRTARRSKRSARAIRPSGARSAILAALYLVQQQQGYITRNAMQHVAEAIGCTPPTSRTSCRSTRCSTRGRSGRSSCRSAGRCRVR